MIWSEEIFKRFVSAELPTQKVLYLNDEESCIIQTQKLSRPLRTWGMNLTLIQNFFLISESELCLITKRWYL